MADNHNTDGNYVEKDDSQFSNRDVHVSTHIDMKANGSKPNPEEFAGGKDAYDKILFQIREQQQQRNISKDEELGSFQSDTEKLSTTTFRPKMSYKRHNFKYGYPLQRKSRYSGGGSSSMTSSLQSSIRSADGCDNPKRVSIDSSRGHEQNTQNHREQNLVRQYSIMENDIRASTSFQNLNRSQAVNNQIGTNHNSQHGNSDPSNDTYRRDLMNEISRQRLSRDLIIVQPLEEQKISNAEFFVSSRTVTDNPIPNDTLANNNQLKVDSVDSSIRRRPRSPVGVQEWVASLPIPSEMSSPPSDFEPMSDQTLENAHIVPCSDNCLSTSFQEKLKYQEKQSLCKKVSSDNELQNIMENETTIHEPNFAQTNIRDVQIENATVTREEVVIQNDIMLSTECPLTKNATKMPYQKDTEDKSHFVYSHTLPSLQIDINEDMNTDELNRGDSNAKNGTLASLTKKKPNQNELNLNLGVSISSQCVRRLSAAFDEMEKAKQEAEDKSRHPSSSSSSFTSEISQEILPEYNIEDKTSNSKNVDNFTMELTSLQTDDLLELGAEAGQIQPDRTAYIQRTPSPYLSTTPKKPKMNSNIASLADRSVGRNLKDDDLGAIESNLSNSIKQSPSQLSKPNQKRIPMNDNAPSDRLPQGKKSIQTKNIAKRPPTNASSTNFRKLPIQTKRDVFLQSHNNWSSYASDVSMKSSVDGILLSRTVDPSELLMELGFGGPEKSYMARIPARFFKESKAKGISVKDFLKRQQHEIYAAETYGDFNNQLSHQPLKAPPGTVPCNWTSRGISSPTKLLQMSIVNKMKAEARKSKLESLNSTKENKHSLINDEAIDKRKEILETGRENSSTVKPNITALQDKRIPFSCVVTQLMSQYSHQSSPESSISGNVGPSSSLGSQTGAAKFRIAAKSILSHPGNRQFMQDSQNKPKIGAKGSERKKRLILGDRTYTIDDDDISVISPTNDKTKTRDLANNSKCSVQDFGRDKEFEKRRATDNTVPINKKSNSSSTSSSFSKRKFSELPKRESSMSLCSSTSIESDWSDEELEEVDRMVQEMQQRIYLPDSEYEEDREVKHSSLESNRSSSSCSTSDVVSVDDIRKLLSSSSLFSQPQTRDKNVSWKRLKRAKLLAVLKMLSIRRQQKREMRHSRSSSTGKSLPTIDETELIPNNVNLKSRLSSSSFSSFLSLGSSEGSIDIEDVERLLDEIGSLQESEPKNKGCETEIENNYSVNRNYCNSSEVEISNDFEKFEVKRKVSSILEEKHAALSKVNEKFAPTINEIKNNRESNILHDHSFVQTAQTMNTTIGTKDVQNIEASTDQINLCEENANELAKEHNNIEKASFKRDNESVPIPCSESGAVSTEKINEMEPNGDENIPEPSFVPHHLSHRDSVIQTLAQMDNRIPLRFVSEQVLF